MYRVSDFIDYDAYVDSYVDSWFCFDSSYLQGRLKQNCGSTTSTNTAAVAYEEAFEGLMPF